MTSYDSRSTFCRRIQPIQLAVDDTRLTFVYIYDKSDMGNVSEAFLDQTIKDIGLGKFTAVAIESPKA